RSPPRADIAAVSSISSSGSPRSPSRSRCGRSPPGTWTRCCLLRRARWWWRPITWCSAASCGPACGRASSCWMVINTYQGVKSVDPKLLEVGRAFRCSEGQLWWNIVLPASLPFIVTGLRLALGRGLIGMVLADLYTAISGIGYLIVRTASTYQVDKMFVPIVTLGLWGVTLTALLRLAEKYVAPWTAGSQQD